MVLILDPDMLDALRAHAERTYPEECCGLLLGWLAASAAGEAARCLVDCVAVDNAWDSEAAAAVASLRGAAEPTAKDTAKAKDRRYWIDPQVILQVQRQARDRGCDIIGVYHSHPDQAAVPSACDRDLAWPDYSYVIVAVAAGQAVDVRSWQLDQQHQFQAEQMRMGAPPPNPALPQPNLA